MPQLPPTSSIDAFIARWESAGGNERANYPLFLTELSELLGLPQPEPAREDTRDNAYVFERRVTFRHGDGSESAGFIDLYHRGAFVLEAKKVRRAEGKDFDDAMLRARGQAEQYARALPAGEGRPPFIVVVDWWQHAADLVRNHEIHRFGLITTNSIKQTFNRRIIEAHLVAKSQLSLAFAIPDHPWVDRVRTVQQCGLR